MEIYLQRKASFVGLLFACFLLDSAATEDDLIAVNMKLANADNTQQNAQDIKVAPKQNVQNSVNSHNVIPVEVSIDKGSYTWWVYLEPTLLWFCPEAYPMQFD